MVEQLLWCEEGGDGSFWSGLMEVTGFVIVKVETLTYMYCGGVFDVVMKSLLCCGLLKLGIADEGEGVFFCG